MASLNDESPTPKHYEPPSPERTNYNYSPTNMNRRSILSKQSPSQPQEFISSIVVEETGRANSRLAENFEDKIIDEADYLETDVNHLKKEVVYVRPQKPSTTEF